MKNLMSQHKWENPKNRFAHPPKRRSKQQDPQKNHAVRSLVFKILSVFLIGFITKKLSGNKK